MQDLHLSASYPRHGVEDESRVMMLCILTIANMPLTVVHSESPCLEQALVDEKQSGVKQQRRRDNHALSGHNFSES